jgi:hypothetical protein
MALPHHAINREALDKLLPGLMPQHNGEFALMDSGKLEGIFKLAAEAYLAGADRFGHSASLMRVGRPAQLGVNALGVTTPVGVN